MALTPDELTARARRVRLIVLDVDGVLTDARVMIEGNGRESKVFSIRDGSAILWAQRAGIDVALLSGRPSPATSRRARELGIKTVLQGRDDKLKTFEKLLAKRRLKSPDVAYMGDDLIDLPVLTRSGLSAAPADAASEVRARVDWVSTVTGGHGAVRELIEVVLRARNAWAGILKNYLD